MKPGLTIRFPVSVSEAYGFLNRLPGLAGKPDDERAEDCELAPLSYPHLSHTEIFDSVEEFYRRFNFRLPKIAAIVSEMAVSPTVAARRLREGGSFSASCASEDAELRNGRATLRAASAAVAIQNEIAMSSTRLSSKQSSG